MSKVPSEPVTVTLTNALMADFEDVSIKAVNQKDMASLIVLHEMGISLRRALTQSVRVGFHDITRGLRLLGVEPNEYQVDWAVSKSPESYWQICGDSRVPLLPGVALEVSIREGKFGLSEVLVETWNTPVTDRVIAQLYDSKRKAPRTLVNLLFNRLPERPVADYTLRMAAIFAPPSVMDRLLRMTPAANLAKLIAASLKSGNEPVAHELLSRASHVNGTVFKEYVLESYPKHLFTPDDQNQSDVHFVESIANFMREPFGMQEIAPFLHAFILRKAERYAGFDQAYDSSSERAWFGALFKVIGVDAIEQLNATARQNGFNVALQRLSQSSRPVFAADILKVIEESAQMIEVDIEGPAP